MTQAPLIRDATIRRRVHGVPKRAALYLLEWLLDLYVFPFSILETGWLCPRKKTLCYQHRMHVAVSHFAQAHVRLTFSFWSECFWILVLYCATYSFLSIYFFFFFFNVQHGKRLKTIAIIDQMFGLKSGVISVLLLGLFIFIDCRFFSGCPPTPGGRKITDWQRNFCSSFQKINDRKISIAWGGERGGSNCVLLAGLYQICFQPVFSLIGGSVMPECLNVEQVFQRPTCAYS